MRPVLLRCTHLLSCTFATIFATIELNLRFSSHNLTMAELHREMFRKSSTTQLQIPLMDHSIVDVPPNAQNCERSGEIVEAGGQRVTRQPILLSEELMPPCRKPGRRSTALAIPAIPSTPSDASQYTFTMPHTPSTPLLPSAFLPSPITPSISRGSDDLPMPNSTPDSTFHDSNLEFSGPSPPVLEDQSWMSFVDPMFSHSCPPFRPPPSKMSDSECLNKAIEFLIDELNYLSVAEFFESYIRQIPWDSSISFSDRHCRTLKVFLQGHAKVKPVDIVASLYQHRYSQASYKSLQKEIQSSFSFHPSVPPRDIEYARPSISTWATQLVSKR